jgi:dolichol-phosphate mannosyltransferase
MDAGARSRFNHGRELRKMKSVAMAGDIRAWSLFRRYAQFCVVGGSGVVVDMGMIWLLASPAMLGWDLTVSKAIAAEVALINNFVWNEVWTFRELSAARAGWRQRLIRFLKFNLICAGGIGLSVVLLNAQVYGLGWNVYLANFIAIVLISIWNFLLNLKFGWSCGADEAPGPHVT